jgi:GDSL-like Lipase/Acylhydrolase family
MSADVTRVRRSYRWPFRFLACALTCLFLFMGAWHDTAAPAETAPSPGAKPTPASDPTPDPALERSLAAEVRRFVQADRVAPPAPCEVLFVGSSSIVKWKRTLAADMAPMPVINRGFGGSHIEYVNRWFDEIVAPYRPRAIVFYAGENDLDAGKSAARVVNDFDEFMARKMRALGATPVYFIALKPSKLRFAQFPEQSAVNAAIRARATRRTDLHYIDVVASMLENDKPKDIFEPDGLHMTAKGYAIWTRLVRAALLPDTEAEARRCRASGSGP